MAALSAAGNQQLYTANQEMRNRFQDWSLSSSSSTSVPSERSQTTSQETTSPIVSRQDIVTLSAAARSETTGETEREQYSTLNSTSRASLSDIVTIESNREASGYAEIDSSTVNLSGSFRDTVTIEAETEFDYGNSHISAEISGRVGHEAHAEASFSRNGYDVDLSAESGVSAEASLTREDEVIEGVTVSDTFSASASVGAGAEARAHQSASLSGVSQGAYAGAHIGAEVGVERESSVGVGDSSAGGGAGVSVGPSVGAQGGGDFSLSGEGVSFDFEADLDLGVGLSVKGNLDLKTADVANGVKAVDDGISSVQEAIVDNTVGKAANNAAKVARRISSWF